MTPKLDMQAVAFELLKKVGIQTSSYIPEDSLVTASFKKTEMLRRLIAEALTAAFESGRIAGLEEAAEVAAKSHAFDSWDDEDLASEDDKLRNEVACFIASDIRALIKGGGE